MSTRAAWPGLHVHAGRFAAVFGKPRSSCRAVNLTQRIGPAGHSHGRARTPAGCPACRREQERTRRTAIPGISPPPGTEENPRRGLVTTPRAGRPFPATRQTVRADRYRSQHDDYESRNPDPAAVNRASCSRLHTTHHAGRSFRARAPVLPLCDAALPLRSEAAARGSADHLAWRWRYAVADRVMGPASATGDTARACRECSLPTGAMGTLRSMPVVWWEEEHGGQHLPRLQGVGPRNDQPPGRHLDHQQAMPHVPRQGQDLTSRWDPCGGMWGISYVTGLDEHGEPVYDLMPCPTCCGTGPDARGRMLMHMARIEAGI